MNNVQLEENYKIELEKTKMLEKGRFAGDFRNYCVHKRLPNALVTIHCSFEPNGSTSTPKFVGFGKEYDGMSFQKTELLKWNEWSEVSLSYFQNHRGVHRGKIYVQSLVNDWQKSLSEFCSWFVKEVQWLYAKEIAEYIHEMKAKDSVRKEFFNKIWENNSI